MKQFYLLLSVLFLSTGLSAQIFVNAAAAGANNGTSWADAYVSLDDALAAAADADQIWVAAGTYVPAGDRFVVGSSISVIGGFAGTETSADEADPVANPTTLSGDVNGDDDPTDINLNRADNKRIMLVDSLIPNGVALSGLIFTGGQTVFDDGTLDLEDISGGAVQTFSPILIDNCAFAGNSSDYGGVTFIGVETSGTTIQNSSFTGNLGLTRGGAIFGAVAVGINITGCTFTENTGARGAAYFEVVNNLSIDNCAFTANTCADRGAAIGTLFCDGVTVTSCDFDGNSGLPDNGVRGGAIYVFDDFELEPDADRVIYEDCSFTANASQGLLGGAVYMLNADAAFNNCEFEQNAGGTFGGAVFVFSADAGDRQANFDDCTFDSNVGGGGGLGSALSAIGVVELNINNTEFVDNGADDIACRGAIGLFGSFDSLAIRSVTNIDSSLFLTNSSADIGGAIYNQNPTGVGEMNVSNTEFAANQAVGSPGGAAYIFNSVESNFDNVIGSFNSSADGGFMLTRGEAPDVLAGTRDVTVTVQNSTFFGNFSTGQGGVIDAATGGDLDVINTEFYNNFVTDAGSGGAIIGNGDTVGQVINVINSTFINNFATGEPGVVAGDDISVFTSAAVPAESVTMLNIQNNAFATAGGFGNVAVEPDAGVPAAVITTSGGNFFVQEPVDFTLDDSDIFQEDVDPSELFTNFNEDNEDIDLKPNPDFDGGNNPLINAGVQNEDTPATDRYGNERTNGPEIGAVECVEAQLPTIFEIVEASDVHTALEGFLNTAGLSGTLNGEGPFTLFAPTDDAFGLLDALTVANVTAALESTLLTHVVEGAVTSDMLSDGQTEPSLFMGADLTFIVDGGVQVFTAGSDTATVILANIPASNGVVHVIDRVLVSVLVSVQNLDNSGLDVTFFPNPVQNYMSVKVDDLTVDQINVNVINLNGQRVSNWTVGNGNNVLDFTRLPAGTYTLEVDIDGQVYSKKIIKQ